MDALPGPPRAQWDGLAAACGNVFATRSWCECWWAHFGVGTGAEPLVLTGGDGSSEFITPLYVTRGPLRLLRFVGSGAADQLGPLCGPAARAGAAAALRTALAASSVRWDVLVGHDISQDEGWAEPLGATVLRRTASPVIDLETSVWDEFLAARSRNFREQVRRRERRLSKAFDVQVRLATRETLDADLSTLFRLHELRWGPDAPFATGALRRFHSDVAWCLLAEGRLRLRVLELDGQPAAALYGFRFAGVDYFHQGGRDPQFAEHSVGFVLLTDSVRAAVEDGMVEYRLLRGDEAYKSRFATRTKVVETMALPRGWKGHVAVSAARLRWQS